MLSSNAVGSSRERRGTVCRCNGGILLLSISCGFESFFACGSVFFSCFSGRVAACDFCAYTYTSIAAGFVPAVFLLVNSCEAFLPLARYCSVGGPRLSAKPGGLLEGRLSHTCCRLLSRFLPDTRRDRWRSGWSWGYITLRRAEISAPFGASASKGSPLLFPSNATVHSSES